MSKFGVILILVLCFVNLNAELKENIQFKEKILKYSIEEIEKYINGKEDEENPATVKNLIIYTELYIKVYNTRFEKKEGLEEINKRLNVIKKEVIELRDAILMDDFDHIVENAEFIGDSYFTTYFDKKTQATYYFIADNNSLKSSKFLIRYKYVLEKMNSRFVEVKNKEADASDKMNLFLTIDNNVSVLNGYIPEYLKFIEFDERSDNAKAVNSELFKLSTELLFELKRRNLKRLDYNNRWAKIKSDIKLSEEKIIKLNDTYEIEKAKFNAFLKKKEKLIYQVTITELSKLSKFKNLIKEDNNFLEKDSLLALSEKDKMFLFCLIEMYFEKKYNEVLAKLEKYENKDLNMHFLMAMGYIKIDDKRNAIKSLNKILEVDQNNKSARHLLLELE